METEKAMTPHPWTWPSELWRNLCCTSCPRGHLMLKATHWESIMSPLTHELDMEGQQRSEPHQLLSLVGVCRKVARTCLQSGQLDPLVPYILTSEVWETRVTAIFWLPSIREQCKSEKRWTNCYSTAWGTQSPARQTSPIYSLFHSYGRETNELAVAQLTQNLESLEQWFSTSPTLCLLNAQCCGEPQP